VLALGLDLVEDKSFDTCGTDGSQIRYNPEWVKKLSSDQLKGMLAHEAGHVAFGHPFRFYDRDPELWNIACDYALNPILMENGLKLPPGPCATNEYKGWSADDIYEKLFRENPPAPKKKGQQQGAGQGCNDPGGCGGMFEPRGEDGEKLTKAELRELESKSKEGTAQAANVAKQQGQLPGNVERAILDTSQPPISWQDKLRKFMVTHVKTDYTWKRPNRRLSCTLGMYLPSFKKEGIGEVVIGVDTSGSIDDAQFALFMKNIQKLVDECAPDIVHVMMCDARVHSVDTFPKGEQINVKVVGRGGTDFRPVFAKIEEMGIHPLCLIYFTDTQGTFPDNAPEYPTLWACTSKGHLPFGEEIMLNKLEG
jgi:predicted metal-dependent peptidase